LIKARSVIIERSMTFLLLIRDFGYEPEYRLPEARDSVP
jgi:hypothetical protein